MKGKIVSNTSFNPSTFDKQAAASLDMIDEQAAAERVQKILHPEPQGARSQAQAGPTLTPAPQTQPQASATRKKRSDAGVPKKPPADPDEIVLRLTLQDARECALGDVDHILAAKIQDQIIAQLQRRLDQLQKAPK